MFGKSLFEYIKQSKENRKKRNFIYDYLKSADVLFPLLNSEYKKVRDYINHNDLTNDVDMSVKLFEDFNTDVLSSITFPEYYKLFDKKAFLIYDIYNMTNIIKRDLPYEIGIRNDNIIKELPSINDSNRESVLKSYKRKKDLSIKLIDLKIEEVRIIKSKIDLFLKK